MGQTSQSAFIAPQSGACTVAQRPGSADIACDEGVTDAAASPNSGRRRGPLRAAAAAVFHAGARDPPPERAHSPRVRHKLRLIPHLDLTRSLLFTPIDVELEEGGPAVRIGRVADRHAPEGAPEASAWTNFTHAAHALVTGGGDGAAEAGGAEAAFPPTASSASRAQSPVTFESKVVSRQHAELWCPVGGPVYVRDTKSSSGTFLNHLRLSPAGVASRPFAVRDGDVLQFGIDYRGGQEEIFRCIKLRIEIDRSPQKHASLYNANTLQRLHTERAPTQRGPVPTGETLSQCCICLSSISVCQALFVAPCTHLFHYKCIRPLLTLHHPGFSCPLCRQFSDLEADVEVDAADPSKVETAPADPVGEPCAEAPHAEAPRASGAVCSPASPVAAARSLSHATPTGAPTSQPAPSCSMRAAPPLAMPPLASSPPPAVAPLASPPFDMQATPPRSPR
ncbi:hypothetical protein MSPP1_003411 [Malassezia sp. CBS 17886]|nr:hypothetical protein MSPP1_003411 [Malassezia sp. CBS 17886]